MAQLTVTQPCGRAGLNRLVNAGVGVCGIGLCEDEEFFGQLNRSLGLLAQGSHATVATRPFGQMRLVKQPTFADCTFKQMRHRRGGEVLGQLKQHLNRGCRRCSRARFITRQQRLQGGKRRK